MNSRPIQEATTREFFQQELNKLKDKDYSGYLEGRNSREASIILLLIEYFEKSPDDAKWYYSQISQTETPLNQTTPVQTDQLETLKLEINQLKSEFNISSEELKRLEFHNQSLEKENQNCNETIVALESRLSELSKSMNSQLASAIKCPESLHAVFKLNENLKTEDLHRLLENRYSTTRKQLDSIATIEFDEDEKQRYLQRIQNLDLAFSECQAYVQAILRSEVNNSISLDLEKNKSHHKVLRIIIITSMIIVLIGWIFSVEVLLYSHDDFELITPIALPLALISLLLVLKRLYRK
jgi:chromosome segregation ATPase